MGNHDTIAERLPMELKELTTRFIDMLFQFLDYRQGVETLQPQWLIRLAENRLIELRKLIAKVEDRNKNGRMAKRDWAADFLRRFFEHSNAR